MLNSKELVLLSKILKNRKKLLNTVTLGDYKETDWPCTQAHLNGMREAYEQVIDLLTFEKE